MPTSRAEVFDEALGAFQHRGRLGRPQGADARRLEHVPQARPPAGRRRRSRRNRFASPRANSTRAAKSVAGDRHAFRHLPRCRHCRARNRAWSAAGLPTAPRPAHVRGRPIPPAECSQPASPNFRRQPCIISSMSHDAEAAANSANLPEFSVSELSAALKRTVEDNFPFVRVRGEISGLKFAFLRPCLFRPQGRQGGA